MPKPSFCDGCNNQSWEWTWRFRDKTKHKRSSTIFWVIASAFKKESTASTMISTIRISTSILCCGSVLTNKKSRWQSSSSRDASTATTLSMIPKNAIAVSSVWSSAIKNVLSTRTSPIQILKPVWFLWVFFRPKVMNKCGLVSSVLLATNAKCQSKKTISSVPTVTVYSTKPVGNWRE